ncbi:MAG: hypothetical protein HFE53_09835 [Turicibacter sp.]|nr:hypothetical protein [Turicibacter sp.]
MIRLEYRTTMDELIEMHVLVKGMSKCWRRFLIKGRIKRAVRTYPGLLKDKVVEIKGRRVTAYYEERTLGIEVYQEASSITSHSIYSSNHAYRTYSDSYSRGFYF